MIDVRIQAGDFEPGDHLQRLSDLPGSAVASFTGLLQAGEDVREIMVEHYAALAKSELSRIAEEAAERWPLLGVILIHRHGRFKPGERVLFAGAASADPAAAAEAGVFLAEALRTRAPFWRKEMLAGGASRWA